MPSQHKALFGSYLEQGPRMKLNTTFRDADHVASLLQLHETGLLGDLLAESVTHHVSFGQVAMQGTVVTHPLY